LAQRKLLELQGPRPRCSAGHQQGPVIVVAPAAPDARPAGRARAAGAMRYAAGLQQCSRLAGGGAHGKTVHVPDGHHDRRRVVQPHAQHQVAFFGVPHLPPLWVHVPCPHANTIVYAGGVFDALVGGCCIVPFSRAKWQANPTTRTEQRSATLWTRGSWCYAVSDRIGNVSTWSTFAHWRTAAVCGLSSRAITPSPTMTSM
jgi:hypothetical protein